jgi:hypothetical protein
MDYSHEGRVQVDWGIACDFDIDQEPFLIQAAYFTA